MASIQRRMGPNVVGFWGALQAFADGFKLIFKEAIIPAKANRVLFILSPILIIAIGLLVWAFIPLSNLNYLVSLDFSLLVIYSVLSFGVYGIIMAGWSSNSRYAFIGSMRSASQLISYEISMSLTKIRLVCIDALECIGAQLCENNTKKFLLAYIVFAPTPEFDWWCADRDPIIEFSLFNNKNCDLWTVTGFYQIYIELIRKGWFQMHYPSLVRSVQMRCLGGSSEVTMEDVNWTHFLMQSILAALLGTFVILTLYVTYTLWLWFTDVTDLLKKILELRKPPYA
jgi:hypothetical protein